MFSGLGSDFKVGIGCQPTIFYIWPKNIPYECGRKIKILFPGGTYYFGVKRIGKFIGKCEKKCRGVKMFYPKTDLIAQILRKAEETRSFCFATLKIPLY